MTVGITAHGVFRPFPDLVERSLEDRWALDVLAFGISVHAKVLRLRRVRSVLAHNEPPDVVFPPA